MQLIRRFSPLSMLLLSINGMIGSAWLFGPLYAAKIAGSTAIISWLLGGVATVLIALTFAELSTFLPIAGGMARFPQLSHGTLTNMIISWVSWLSCVTMPPIEVQATLQYASTYFPLLTHEVNNVIVLSNFGLIWAAILMVFLAVINVASFRGLIGSNLLLFCVKISIIVFTVSAFANHSFHAANFIDLKSSLSASSWHAILAAVASGGIAFAFTGFTHGIAMAGEAKNSQLTIPLAVIGSVICCLFLYLGLQITFIGALDPSMIQQGWQNLTFAGHAGPLVGIAMFLGLAWLVKLLYIDATLSPMGAGLIYSTTTSRTVYAMSKNGYFPPFLAKLNKQGLPVNAVALNCFIGMFLFLLPGWQAMVDFLVSAVVISYAMGPISLLCLRQQLPHEKRPFRLPWANVICMLAFYCCNLISYWTGWDTIWKLAIAIAVGLILLIVGYVRGSVNKEQFGVQSLVWLTPYLLGLFAISYFGSFGGKGYIPFGWDFLVIGIFSVVVLMLAVATRQGAAQQQFKIYQAEMGIA